VQTTFDVGEGLHGFNYTGCAVLLSLGVLWSCRISLWVWNDGTKTSWRDRRQGGAFPNFLHSDVSVER
jgi:hypothetical protein